MTMIVSCPPLEGATDGATIFEGVVAERALPELTDVALAGR